MLAELGADAQLERFRLEYETLYRALKKSHESEKRLLKKCRELTTETTTTSNRVATANKLSQEDLGTIAQLKKDIEKTWAAVEQSHDKEAITKEQLNALRSEIENLRQTVEQVRHCRGPLHFGAGRWTLRQPHHPQPPSASTNAGRRRIHTPGEQTTRPAEHTRRAVAREGLARAAGEPVRYPHRAACRQSGITPATLRPGRHCPPHHSQVNQVRAEVGELGERLKTLELEKSKIDSEVIELTTGGPLGSQPNLEVSS